MIILDNFSVRKTDKPGFKLTGYVYDHPSFIDGSGIVLSNPMEFDRKARVIITRSGTKYKLGKIDVQYAQMYENAENRLFNTLEERMKNE